MSIIYSSSLLSMTYPSFCLKGCITYEVACPRPCSFLRKEFGRWSAAALGWPLSSVEEISLGTMVPKVVSTNTEELRPLPTRFWKFLETLLSYVDVWYMLSPWSSFLSSLIFYAEAQWPRAGSVSRACSLNSCSRFPGSDYTVGHNTL